MARILITSGPTRQYLDPVRYLTNASSGQMGAALARSAAAQGHEVLIVSGPVAVRYPAEIEVIEVVTTDEMLAACQEHFPKCDGLIGAAAPCDYRPVKISEQKITKTGEPLHLHLIETADIVATLGVAKKSGQWLVGFALETEDRHFRAVTKLEQKSCALMVLNGPAAINAAENDVEVIDPQGKILRRISGEKQLVADGILEIIGERLCA